MSELNGNVVDAVYPANTAEVSAFLRFARDHRGRVHPQGSGSKLSWLNGDAEGTRLHMSRMDALLDHTWQDMTCTVEAGCTWQSLQEALARHGQQVALDPLWPHRGTVGGVVAANDSGALRLRYGGLRDLLIGMTVVLADGTIARSGGKVVKNVAGYDLPKLFCGSFGTLGVIADVTFRLHSIKPYRTTLTAVSRDVELLHRLLLRVLGSHLNAESMQLRTVQGGFALDVRLAAQPEALAHQVEQFTAMTDCAVEPAEDEKPLWAAREELFGNAGAGAAAKGGEGVDKSNRFVFKATVLPTRIAASLKEIADLGGEAVAQATGIVTGWVDGRNEAGLGRLRVHAEGSSGSLTLLQVPPDSTLDRWGTLPSSLPLMRRVKQKLDPEGMLNPGRFLGGF